MSSLAIRPAGACRYDLLALGEVMLRLDPGEGRIRCTRAFQVWEGGGEYNVARGLRRCFGLRTALVTAFADNAVGRLLEDFILQGGVDARHVKWMPFDGVGRNVRNGLNFTERGYGVRGAVGVSDRGHTAVSQLKRGDINWKKIFKDEGARWFHCGGIFAALSETTPDIAREAMECAKENGTIVSYDLNYRPSLWKAIGGSKKAIEVNRSLAPFIDVMIGNEEDFTAALGFEVPGLDAHCSNLDPANFKKMIDVARSAFPNFQAIATTLRNVKSASINEWSATLWMDGHFHQAQQRTLEILDRVGGGDSFASGLIYGFLSGLDPRTCVEYGAAHGALAMTTPGDTSMATLAEVKNLAGGGSARVQR
jgi:2-dehydro-3-deoxygluconokinase